MSVLWYHHYRTRLAQELEGNTDVQAVQEERVRVMDSTNPRVVLRNYIAQNAIEAAESGDFSEVWSTAACGLYTISKGMHFCCYYLQKYELLEQCAVV